MENDGGPAGYPAPGDPGRTTGAGPGAAGWRPVLVGREDEVARLSSLIRRGRLVTVTGAPGVGKSRLVAEVAATLGPPASTVATVALGEVGDPAAVATTAAAIRAEADVIVLDDCDAVVGAAADAARMLTAAGIAVVATSREPLCVDGEVVWRLGPLTLPEAGADTLPAIFVDSDAVRLFCERAAAARRGFVPTDDVAAALARICRRLAGLPLAIQLAARWAHALSVAEIEARLDDPFSFLVVPDAPPAGRHRGLGAAIAASYDRLPPGLRALWRRLSVFAGGFALDEAQAVCRTGDAAPGQVFDGIAGLVDRSLVEADTAATPTVYRLLEPLLRFARDRLDEAGEAAATVDAHTRWCADLAAKALGSPGVEGGVARLVFYRFDVAAALEHAFNARQAEAVIRLGLAEVRLRRSAGDDRQAWPLLERMLAATEDGAAPARAALLRVAGELWATRGGLDRATTLLADSTAVATAAGDTAAAARAHTLLGKVSVLGGRPERGLQALAEAVALARVSADAGCLAAALAAAGRAHLFVGDVTAAAVELAESRAMIAGGVDALGEAGAMLDLGWAGMVGGDYDQAGSDLAVALNGAALAGDVSAQALAHAWSGESARRRGEDERAVDHLRQCLGLVEGMPYAEALGLVGLGRLALGRADGEDAGEWFYAARGIAERHGLAALMAPCLLGLAGIAHEHGDHDGAQGLLDAALASARQCRDAAGEADAYHGLGVVVATRGDDRRALTLYQRALAMRRPLGDPAAMAGSFEALAGTAARSGDPRAAARLLGAADGVRTAYGCARSKASHAGYVADLASARAALGQEQFAAEWSRGGAMSLDEAVKAAARHGARESRPAHGWAALTPAERTVAVLAARGMTNKAIARQLAASERTIETHLQRIYRKVGINSRQQLARHALDT